MQKKESFEIHQSSVGVIIDSKLNSRIGTGFIVGQRKLIATCSHVVTSNSDYLYMPVNSEVAYSLKVIHNFPEYDVAFLNFVGSKPKDIEAREFGDIHTIRPGSSIAYFGWESNTNSIKVNQVNVLSCGSQLRNDMIVDYIEFLGIARPGYSGGPVIDFLTGKVVAMVAEGGYVMGFDTTNKVLINRAFSIEMLKIADKYLHLSN